MTSLVPLLAVFLAGTLLLVAVLAVVALSRAVSLQGELRALRTELERLRRAVEGEAPQSRPTPAAETAAEGPQSRRTPAAETTTEGPQSRPTPVAEMPSAPSAHRPLTASAPSASSRDFATTLGPKLLVATGALAFVVFLGLFVKYAWENEWIGPAGRVLFGAVLGIGLVALGVRLMGHRYRPLGQGLAGAGLASLYVSAYGAHGFYDLVPRWFAGALMVAITVGAVLLAARLNARLLATLAWTGGYLTPVLLSTGEDKAVSLFAYLLLLGAGALVLDRRRPWPETLPLAMSGTLLHYTAWYSMFFRPERLGVAAFGLLLFTGLFVLGPRRDATRTGWPALALLTGGIMAAILAGDVDRPRALVAVLLAYSALAILMRAWWRGAEMVGLGAAALAVLVWMDRHWSEGRGDLWILALPVAGAYLLSLVIRGLLLRRPFGRADAAVHLLDAAFVWAILCRVFLDRQPSVLAALSVAMAALYLGLGLAAARATGAGRQSRTLLGLAAVFVTLAIPIHFGLDGITLAWAAEGLLLLALGLWFDSALVRAGAYGVLGLAVVRLPLYHLPLHGIQPFTPVLNRSFGIWLAVIVALAAAYGLLRRARPSRFLDRAMVPWLALLAFGLLFALLTAETGDGFDAAARAARAAADLAGAEHLRLAGRLAQSVLWTLFATGLLSGGLALRSRPLFYSAYALFAVTAFKVVTVDLATLGTLYRMLSFLALALLLTAGAYLNLRFRERLLPQTP